MMRITKTMNFDAAHYLDGIGPADAERYGRMHGHSFSMTVTIAGTPDAATGWVADFDDCLLYTSPSPRDRQKSRMPSSA